MDKQELKNILEQHKLWLDDPTTGKPANLQSANLQSANLRDADLRDADLQDANLRGADLRNSDLQYANLRGADLKGADLQDADLRGANLDYSCWPLWCGSFETIIDENQAIQLLYHAFIVGQKFWPGDLTDEQRAFLNSFKHATKRF